MFAKPLEVEVDLELFKLDYQYQCTDCFRESTRQSFAASAQAEAEGESHGSDPESDPVVDLCCALRHY